MSDRGTPSWVLITAAIIGAVGTIIAAILAHPKGNQTPESRITAVAEEYSTVTHSESCVVPSLEQLEQGAASAQLSNLGLQTIKSNQYNAEVDAGLVLSHEPPEGKILNPCQGSVIIVVSLGPTPSPAPASIVVETPESMQSDSFDISGTWSGFITQNHVPKHWDMILKIQQNGNYFSGESIKSPENYSARVGYDLQGQILEDNEIQITEAQQIFVEAGGNWDFCAIFIEARIVDSDSLIGEWECINNSSRSYGHTEFTRDR